MHLSEAEWKVMRVLWERSPANAREVLEGLASETDWAYTTTKTILSRLVEKGVLAEHKRANTSFYEPLVSRDDARRTAVRSLLDRAFDGTFGSLLHHLADGERLSKRDREKLREVLEGKGRKNAR